MAQKENLYEKYRRELIEINAKIDNCVKIMAVLPQDIITQQEGFRLALQLAYIVREKFKVDLENNKIQFGDNIARFKQNMSEPVTFYKRTHSEIKKHFDLVESLVTKYEVVDKQFDKNKQLMVNKINEANEFGFNTFYRESELDRVSAKWKNFDEGIHACFSDLQQDYNKFNREFKNDLVEYSQIENEVIATQKTQQRY